MKKLSLIVAFLICINHIYAEINLKSKVNSSNKPFIVLNVNANFKNGVLSTRNNVSMFFPVANKLYLGGKAGFMAASANNKVFFGPSFNYDFSHNLSTYFAEIDLCVQKVEEGAEVNERFVDVNTTVYHESWGGVSLLYLGYRKKTKNRRFALEGKVGGGIELYDDFSIYDTRITIGGYRKSGTKSGNYKLRFTYIVQLGWRIYF